MDNCNFKLSKGLMLGFMKDEQAAADYYQQLAAMLPDVRQREIVEKIRDDEIKHYIMLRELYTKVFRCKPDTALVAANAPVDVKNTLMAAIQDELNSYEEYRNTYLVNCDGYARSVFFELMSDEIEHSVWLNYLLHLNA